MAHIQGERLDTGSQFPAIEYKVVGGGTLSLPSDRWTIALFYRGVW